MAEKTATLTSTSINPGWRSNWSDTDWNGYSDASGLSGSNSDNWVGKAGYPDKNYYATNILFDSTTLASLKNKTITSVKLTLTVVSGTIPIYENYPIGYKYNASDKGTEAWKRTSKTACAGYLKSSSKIDASNTSITITLENTVPTYGYVIGSFSESLNASVKLGTSATLVIKYNDTYLVSYNGNNSTGTVSNLPSSQTKNAGTNLTLSSTKPTRSNDTATGYTITFNANGGRVSSSSASSSTSKTATRTTKYTFSKWNTKAGGGGTDYAAGAIYSTDADATMYAQWTSTVSDSITLLTPVRIGYTFKGWYDESSGGNKIGNAGATYAPTANKTLYAHWENQYGTVYEISGNVLAGWRASAYWNAVWSGYSSADSLSNTDLKYRWIGKYSNDLRAINILFDSTTLAAAKARTIVSITLTITVISGTIPGGTTNTTYPIGYKKTSSTTDWERTSSSSVAGYIRTSSATEASNTLLDIDMGTTVPTYGYTAGPYSSSLNISIRLGTTAKLTIVTSNQYTLSYNANGGNSSSVPSSQTGTGNPSYTFTISSTKPTRNNAAASTNCTITYNKNGVGAILSTTSQTSARTISYTFSKWYLNAGGTGTAYSPGGTITVNENTTLYATWSSSTSAAAVTLPTPTRKGYTFKGWYTAASGGTKAGNAGASYTPSGSVTSVTLYAQWTCNGTEYTLSGNVLAGWRSSWGDADWNGYSSASTLSTTDLKRNWIGKYSNNVRAINILFTESTLRSLRLKNILAIFLTITVTGSNASSSNYAIGYKLNNSTTDWTRSNAASSASSTSVKAGSIPTFTDASGLSIDIDMGTTVPVYGYTSGPPSQNFSTSIYLGATATLTIVAKNENTIRIVNGSSLDTYTIYVVENGALVPYVASVVNGSNLDPYS